MAKINNCVAMGVGRDQRLQLLNSLCIGGVIELDRVLLPIEVGDRLGTDARGKYEVIAIGAGDWRILLGLRSRLLGFRLDVWVAVPVPGSSGETAETVAEFSNAGGSVIRVPVPFASSAKWKLLISPLNPSNFSVSVLVPSLNGGFRSNCRRNPRIGLN
jgi:hypothetical protein